MHGVERKFLARGLKLGYNRKGGGDVTKRHAI